ncbi:MAG TPA: hypothetical protein VE338_14450 [Ktedonobacterales bacterium]|jgi:predicted ferric reductase|nr:hypothetical protein [Ktedonobacterales bacterium]
MSARVLDRQRSEYRGARLAPRILGPIAIVALIVALAVIWVIGRPANVPTARFIGQLVGAEGVLLMSMGLVLISTLQWVERWFNGIDHAAYWHRAVTIAGTTLVAVHAGVTSNPRKTSLGADLGVIGLTGLIVLVVWAIAPRWPSFTPKRLRPWILEGMNTRPVRFLSRTVMGYGFWRFFHRFTGLFVAIGFAHGLIDGTVFGSQALRWTYIVVAGAGLAFYIYRELLARRFAHMLDYQVESVRPIDATTVEISLKPLGQPLDYKPGQFAIVYLEAKDGWHRHPFTITSAPHESNVRFAVKALGDFTSGISTMVEPGMPAVISRPHGDFDYRRGTERQIWIAGGVGITPILSWLRSASPGQLPRHVDLFYTSRGPAAYSAELRELAARHGSVRPHIIDTSSQSSLTPEQVLDTVGGEPRTLSVFMCGPEQLVTSFHKAMLKAGVKPANIHREYFNLR